MNAIEDDGETTLIVWGMDIEEEEEKTDIIFKNQADVQKIVDALPMAMIIENSITKDVYYANTAFFALMGYISIPDVFEINEKNFFNYEQADSQSASEREAGFMKLLVDGETAVMEFTYKNIRGKRIDARVSASEIIYGGKTCVLKIIQDIGEEKLRTQLLQDAANHEREANRLKSSFLANMSHEIRTPMNAIIGFAQIALMREQEPQNVDVFKKISSSAKNLLTIINDILDFSKIEAQRIDLVEDVFAVEDIIANAFMVAADRIEDKKVEMLLDISPEIPLNLYGDKTRLWQILKNLLDNSAKYTEQGFVILKVYPGDTINGKLNIIFEVKDTGIGMTDEQVSKLFIPFNQFSDNYRYKSSGTGLGMSIIKQLLDLMEGKIKVESKIGEGTKITVTIPFKEAEDKTTLSKLVSKSVPEEFKILIADDDPISCEIMQRLLETAGFSAVYVHSGAEVINEVKKKAAAGESFNVIILDYFLGEDNGLEVGRELLKYTAESKLLMVSAYVKKIPGIEIREIGFKDVLQKPLIPSMFIKRLVDTLGAYDMAPAAGYKKFKDVSVLLCEDNLLNREIAVEMLRILNIEADTAGDGNECLEMLEAKKYDLVLMDILMPNMDGKEATLRIRASDKPYKDVCIIAMTANVMTEQIEEFMKAGMNGHIPKPIEFNTLHDNLVKHLPDGKQNEEVTVDLNLDAANASFIIDGIAVSEGLARFGGNEERYKMALLRFANDKETYHSDEGKDFGRYIHTLKGVTANLGMARLAELARTVEGEFKQNNPYDESYTVLKEELREVSLNIKAAIKENEFSENLSEFGKKGDYFKLLENLKEALKNGNANDSETLVKKLSRTKWIGISRPDFKPIEEAVNNYDFIKALELTENLYKK